MIIADAGECSWSQFGAKSVVAVAAEARGMGQAEWACDVACRLLKEPLPRRWAHTQGVARRVDVISPVLGDDVDLVRASAWLHDIGYSPDLVGTRLHALDGARYLRDVERAERPLCRLVAHHSCATIEAAERGLVGELVEEFEEPPRDLLDALLYCDMMTGPSGERLSAERRVDEILSRYGTHHVVSRFMRKAIPGIMEGVDRVESRLASHTANRERSPAQADQEPATRSQNSRSSAARQPSARDIS